MAKGLPIVVCIPSEKRNFAQPMEKGNYLLVLHSLGARVHSDLLYGNPPRLERTTLVFQYVLVKKNHRVTLCSTYSGAAYSAT